jgi:hypothetical protein
MAAQSPGTAASTRRTTDNSSTVGARGVTRHN